MLQEFKDFAMRGNVVDMAVGIVIGGPVRGKEMIFFCPRRSGPDR